MPVSRRSPLLLVCVTFALTHGAATLSAAAPERVPKVGGEAPDFELPTLQGEPIRLSKLLDEGPVVLIVLRGYPGYQCPLCSAQVGQFLAKAKQFEAARARLVMVYPGPADGLKEHADEFIRGKTLPGNAYLLLDPDFAFVLKYGLRWEAEGETAYPSTFVIDAGRRIRFVKVSQTHGGRASVDEVLKALQP